MMVIMAEGCRTYGTEQETLPQANKTEQIGVKRVRKVGGNGNGWGEECVMVLLKRSS